MSSVAESITPIPAPARMNGPTVRMPVDPYADGNGDRLFEVVRGVRLEKNMGVLQNMIAATLYGFLAPFCRDRGLGRAAIETMFAIPGSGNDRKPDVAFVSFQRWPNDREIPEVNAWPIAPELAVEVISPTDRAFDVMDKVAEYFDGGVQQVWHVYSKTRRVLIFSSPTTIRVLTDADELTGEPILPGFRIRVVDLFPNPVPTS
jgi:Uma2 family endonuclease